jgi:hypothetical protein
MLAAILVAGAPLRGAPTLSYERAGDLLTVVATHEGQPVCRLVLDVGSTRPGRILALHDESGKVPADRNLAFRYSLGMGLFDPIDTENLRTANRWTISELETADDAVSFTLARAVSQIGATGEWRTTVTIAAPVVEGEGYVLRVRAANQFTFDANWVGANGDVRVRPRMALHLDTTVPDGEYTTQVILPGSYTPGDAQQVLAVSAGGHPAGAGTLSFLLSNRWDAADPAYNTASNNHARISTVAEINRLVGSLDIGMTGAHAGNPGPAGMARTFRGRSELAVFVGVAADLVDDEPGGGDDETFEPPPMSSPFTPITRRAYYVDFESGNDQNPGTSPESPWKRSPGDASATGRAASTVLQPGDGVIFKGGVVYRGTVTLSRSGTADNPVVFDGNSQGTFGEGKAIIDGSDVLGGWEPTTLPGVSLPVYVTALPAGESPFTLTLYSDDQRMLLAQGPNVSNHYLPDNLDEYYRVGGHNVTLTSIRDTVNLPKLFETTGPELAYVSFWADDNRIRILKIQNYDATTSTITFPSVSSVYSTRVNYYAVLNHVSVFDKPGEYFVDTQANLVYMIPFAGFDPQTTLITRGVRRVGIDIRAHHVSVQHFVAQRAVGAEGVVRDGAGIRVWGSGVSNRWQGIVIQDNEVRFNSSYQKYGAIFTEATDGLRILRNRIYRNAPNRSILATSGHGTEIRRNTVSEGGYTGIAVFTTTGAIIANNHVYDVRAVHANGISVYLQSHDTLIVGNIVERGNIALTTQHSQNITVAFNVFETEGLNYTVADWGNGGGNLKYYNNIMINERVDWGHGLYVSASSRDNLIVKNNIMDGQDAGQAGPGVSHNIYTGLSKNQQSGGWQPASTELIRSRDQVYRDFANRDYRPLPDIATYPAADTEFTEDIVGHPVRTAFIGPYFPLATIGWNADWSGSHYSYGEWSYHADHHWSYRLFLADDSSMHYDQALARWLYSSAALYPGLAVWRAGNWQWLLYLSGSAGDRLFYDPATHEVIHEQSLIDG